MALLSPIEDFLWFRLTLVRSARLAEGGPPAPGGALTGPYTLDDLQQYLQQYPASHYTHNGACL